MTTELDLPALRNEIDEIDNQILALFARRIELVLRVGEFKRSNGLPVYDAGRERTVIARLIQNKPDHLDAQVVRRVFERIIDEARGIEQHQHQDPGTKLPSST